MSSATGSLTIFGNATRFPSFNLLSIRSKRMRNSLSSKLSNSCNNLQGRDSRVKDNPDRDSRDKVSLVKVNRAVGVVPANPKTLTSIKPVKCRALKCRRDLLKRPLPSSEHKPLKTKRERLPVKKMVMTVLVKGTETMKMRRVT